MAYEDYEESQASARPVEAYKFVGTTDNYLYTSTDMDVTIGGELYTAQPIRREAMRATTQDDEQLTLDIEMPFNLDVVQDYAFASSPPDLDLQIYRIHWGMNFASDAVCVFNGPVVSFSVDGQRAKLRATSVFSAALASPVPPRFWQKPCNHVLFDARCTLADTSYKVTATVGTFDGVDIHVDDDGFADDYLIAGEMITTRSGERRLIMANVANLITVNFPFHDLETGDEVTLRAGCDHSFAVCKSKFSNEINFGGFPYIPADNPFEGEL